VVRLARFFASCKSGSTEADRWNGLKQLSLDLTMGHELAPGMARFVVQVDSGDWETFTVSGRNVDDTKASWASKYGIQIKIKGTEIKPGIEIVDQSPLRAIQSVTTNGSTNYELALDDQRPWRVALLSNPDRLVVDIGGIASSINKTIAVYAPRPGDPGMRPKRRRRAIRAAARKGEQTCGLTWFAGSGR